VSAASYGWKVGMSVFVPRHLHGHDVDLQEWKVSKVGRMWVHIGRNGVMDKFAAETMILGYAGYGGHVKAFPSEAEYYESTEISKRWVAVYRVVHGRAPAGITLEQIATIEAILGITPIT